MVLPEQTGLLLPATAVGSAFTVVTMALDVVQQTAFMLSTVMGLGAADPKVTAPEP